MYMHVYIYGIYIVYIDYIYIIYYIHIYIYGEEQTKRKLLLTKATEY